jgi:sterol 3beta-glucosyltransferase
MRIVLATIGSRGEADPLIALLVQLQRRGHEVLFIAMEEHHSQADAYGLKTLRVRGNLRASLAGPESRDVWAGKRDAVERWDKTFFLPAFRRILDAVWEGSQSADVLILGSGLIPAQRVGEILNIPTFIGCMFPALSPTRYFPHILGPQLRLGPFVNRLSYVINQLFPAGQYRVISEWSRETLGERPPIRYKNYLKPNGRRLPILYCYSELLFPSPPDWQDSVCVSGFHFLPEDPTWRAPQGLVDFLHDGPPPVCISFSSMIGPHPELSTKVIAEAIRRLPDRVLVCGGWGGLQNLNLPGNAFFIQGAPFHWLFPQVRAVVHHGGSGITSTTIRAGKPAVICPVGGDHAFWATLAHQKGVAPAFRMHRDLTPDWLADSIEAVLRTPSMARAAEDLGDKLRKEDSSAKAIEFLEQRIDSWSKK